jgi:hypothetical protein
MYTRYHQTFYLYEATFIENAHTLPSDVLSLRSNTYRKRIGITIRRAIFTSTRSLYPECIANLKLPIDAFYRESRSSVNVAKRYITTGLFGLGTPVSSNNKLRGTLCFCW